MSDAIRICLRSFAIDTVPSLDQLARTLAEQAPDYEESRQYAGGAADLAGAIHQVQGEVGTTLIRVLEPFPHVEIARPEDIQSPGPYLAITGSAYFSSDLKQVDPGHEYAPIDPSQAAAPPVVLRLASGEARSAPSGGTLVSALLGALVVRGVVRNY